MSRNHVALADGGRPTTLGDYMKIRLFAALPVLGLAVAAPAFAQSTYAPVEPPPAPAPAPVKPVSKADAGGFYAGGGISVFFFDKSFTEQDLPVDFIDTPNTAAFVGRAGYAFNEYLAVEGEFGVGGASSDFGDEDDNVYGSIRIANTYGGYLVGTLPLDGFYAIGKAGYQSITLEREYFGSDAPDVKSSGVAFGAGGGMRGESWDFRMTYTVMSGDATNGALGMDVLFHF